MDGDAIFRLAHGSRNFDERGLQTNTGTVQRAPASVRRPMERRRGDVAGRG